MPPSIHRPSKRVASIAVIAFAAYVALAVRTPSEIGLIDNALNVIVHLAYLLVGRFEDFHSHEAAIVHTQNKRFWQWVGLAPFRLAHIGMHEKDVLVNDMQVRLISADGFDSDLDRGLVLYFHGGGFVLGDHKLDFDLLPRIATQTGHVVASLRYRLAPENKYPAQLEDVKALVEFVMHNREHLKKHWGADNSKVFSAGHSAGGNLAAVAALVARDLNFSGFKKQCLLNPVLRYGAQTKSHVEAGDAPALSSRTMNWFWQQYSDLSLCDSYCQPVITSNTLGVVGGVVFVSTFDVLRDEGVEYASKMNMTLKVSQSSHFGGVLVDRSLMSEVFSLCFTA